MIARLTKLLSLLVLWTLLLPAASQAATVTYSLPDILTFDSFTNTDITATYSGNGFGGMYGTAPRWGHLFGVEGTSNSRTIMQVDISGLAGQSIVSAALSFLLLDGVNWSQNVSLTGFDGGTGALTYQWDAPPANYGSVIASVTGGAAANTIDVTSLFAASVGAGDSWFGMHLQGTSANMYTFTGAGLGSADRAQVQLTVETAVETVAVPEPGTLALLGLGLFGLGAMRRLIS